MVEGVGEGHDFSSPCLTQTVRMRPEGWGDFSFLAAPQNEIRPTLLEQVQLYLENNLPVYEIWRKGVPTHKHFKKYVVFWLGFGSIASTILASTYIASTNLIVRGRTQESRKTRTHEQFIQEHTISICSENFFTGHATFHIILYTFINLRIFQ